MPCHGTPSMARQRQRPGNVGPAQSGGGRRGVDRQHEQAKEKSVTLKTWWAAVAVCIPLLHGCGGSGDDAGTGYVRLVNATDDYASLDLYASDTLLNSGVETGNAGSYASLSGATYSMLLKSNGSSTTASTSSRTVGSGGYYTLVAYTTAESLRSAYLSDTEDAPSSGIAKLRVFNTSTEAGSVDIYVTATDADLSSSSANFSSLGTERISSYVAFGKSTYRIRVTAAGDKSDLRLDIPSIALADQQIATLVLTTTPGGVLVHGLLINQQGSTSAQRNTSARLRLVASAASNGTVAATANGTTLTSGLKSPAIGNYTLVDAGDLTLAVTVDGTSVDASGHTLAAGSDTTLLVTGDASAATATLIADDNRPALSSANTKLRLVHAVSGLASPITLTADYSAIATDLALNAASTPASTAASTTFRLEATSTAVSGSLYLATDVTLLAGRVYTVFMLGDATTPVGQLRRDR
jgi:hypothetical protein